MQKLRKYLIISLIIISTSFILFNSKKEYLSEDNILGVYINNELSDNYPSKDSAMFQKAICDDASTKVTWDNDNWGLLISNLNKKVKCNLYFYSGETVFDFDYTGGEQTFIAPVSGTYKLETWGAQGGSSLKTKGGFGGYSLGKIYLDEKSNLFINVGGIGFSDDDEKNIGGYNGGGYSGNYSGSKSYGGGGATHIARISGILKNLENEIINIYIVSGGGGGSYSDFNTKLSNGGGFIGNDGETNISLYKSQNFYTGGGTQTGPGRAFWGSADEGLVVRQGVFGSGIKDFSRGFGGGGGGGLYGGSTGFGYSGGGGSGYIGNSILKDKVMYCYNCEESNEESTKTISTTCNEETPTSYCAKKGNGYARITLVSIDE